MPAMPGLINVRPLELEDLDAVAAMGGTLVRLHHQWDDARFFLPPNIERGYRNYFASQLSAKQTTILVAELEGRVVGYVFASLVERDWSDLRDACGKVHDLYVCESARGRGAGRALLEEAVRRLEAAGVPRVVLMVAAKNTEAHQFFETAGFRDTMIEMTRERSGTT
jgi:GNAT superfamily N-acetyltransferase